MNELEGMTSAGVDSTPAKMRLEPPRPPWYRLPYCSPREASAYMSIQSWVCIHGQNHTQGWGKHARRTDDGNARSTNGGKPRATRGLDTLAQANWQEHQRDQQTHRFRGRLGVKCHGDGHCARNRHVVHDVHVVGVRMLPAARTTTQAEHRNKGPPCSANKTEHHNTRHA
jgi:hypothetical protein